MTQAAISLATIVSRWDLRATPRIVLCAARDMLPSPEYSVTAPGPAR
ncbi:hypothetical protein AB0B45_35190 [Nonomuraea sp. NPDC049152]